MDDAQTDAPKVNQAAIIELNEKIKRWGQRLHMLSHDDRMLVCELVKRAALASPRATASHAGDPFESPAHAVARLSDEVRAPSRSPLRAQVEALRERHIERCPHAGVHASGLDCVCGASGFNRALNAVLALLDTASPSPDWRDSEAVKKLYDIVRLAATREDTDLLVDVWLPKLCDAVAEYVQSHARQEQKP